MLSDAQKDRYRDNSLVARLLEENAEWQTGYERLEKENAELRARLAVEHGSRFKANRRPALIESAPPKHPRGAPKGHPAWNRPPG